jgi:hypothetical protein
MSDPVSPLSVFESAARAVSRARRRVGTLGAALSLLLTALGGCGPEDPSSAASESTHSDGGTAADQGRAPGPGDRFARILPWRAINLVGPTDLIWDEYDYRPAAQGGHREEIDATLARLKSLGVRQVQIQTMYAWSVESAPGPTQSQSVVYLRPGYRADDASTWGPVPRTRRGDMGLVPYLPSSVPAHWDQPVTLRTPVELGNKAEQILGELLDAVGRAGLVPVLKSEIYLVVAEDAYDFSGDFNYTDPSRGFDTFYAQYQEHLVRMTRLAARHGAAMMILGTETPYVAGAGQSRFADGSLMSSRQALIAGKWREIIAAVRGAAVAESRPDLLFGYTEINPFWEGHYAPGETPVPVWSRVPFWDDLDVVGINFYLPGRWSDGAGSYDREPRTADEMVTYGETHDFASDTIPNLVDMRRFFVEQKGYSVAHKPVIFTEDGCTSTPVGAANPAAPPFLTERAPPDFTEQRNLYEAHFKLVDKHGAGWLGGLGFWQVTPTRRWGGTFRATDTAPYSKAAAYFSFLDTPTEDVIKQYFSRP